MDTLVSMRALQGPSILLTPSWKLKLIEDQDGYWTERNSGLLFYLSPGSRPLVFAYKDLEENDYQFEVCSSTFSLRWPCHFALSSPTEWISVYKIKIYITTGGSKPESLHSAPWGLGQRYYAFPWYKTDCPSCSLWGIVFPKDRMWTSSDLGAQIWWKKGVGI